MRQRAVFAAPLFVALALHVWASGEWAQDAFVATLLLAAIFVGGRLRIGATGRRVLTTVFFAAGAAMGWAHDPDLGYGPGTLPRSASLVAVGSLLAAATRLYVRAEWTRERATFVLGMLAVAASGATRLGQGYGVLAGTYLAFAFYALRRRDPARATARDLGARDHLALAASLAIAGAIAFGLTRAAPRAYDAAQRAFDRAYARDVVGFGAGAWLGSMRAMIKSEDEVLRVEPPPHAPPIDYLRGAVYDEYRSDGFWSASDFADRMRDVAAGPREGRGPRVRVRRVAGDATRYFLPLRARELVVPGALVAVDGGGDVRTTRSSRATEYTFVLGDRDELAPRPPSAADVVIPPSERAAIGELAREWTDGIDAPQDVLEAIRVHLAREYTYSLSFTREADDPLLDFLFQRKLGYCTYFASAMTMLARARGIPARLVAGYRVSEWSPVTGEYVVREKNAHAWVEAWVAGAWRTFDPTPLSELPQDQPHVAALSTLAADAFGRMERAVVYAVEHVTPGQLVAAIVVLGALWSVVRALRKRAARTVTEQADDHAQRPLPCFERLAASLEKDRGIARAASESLEGFARRLARSGLPDAAALVERYAALRYGGRGDGESLDRDVAAFVASVAPRT